MPQPLLERRVHPRYDTDVSATLLAPNLRIGVRMLSVSAGGALVRMDRLSSKVFDEDLFVIEIFGIGRIKGSKKWRRDTDIGVKFELGDIDRLRLAERLAERFGPRPARTAPLRAQTSYP